MPARVRTQLAIQIDPDLLARIRTAAADQGSTVTATVVALLEAGLGSGLGRPRQDPGSGLGMPSRGLGSPELEARVSALEAAVAALQGHPVHAEPTPAPAQIADGETIGSAQVAAQLGLQLKTLQARIRRAGGGRVGLSIDGWRIVGQTPASKGGPPVWAWQAAA